MMVGRDTTGLVRQAGHEIGAAIYEIDNLSALSSQGLKTLKGITLTLHRGEILGIAGVSGNGQSELTKVLTGLLFPTSGTVTLEGQDLTHASPSTITKAGVGRTPEDRHEGMVGDLTVAENLAMEDLKTYTHNGFLDQKAIIQDAEQKIKDFQIKASPTDPLRKLSGGNMQKVVMARALSRNPKVVIASQPTRGLDVGATEYIRKKLLEERDRGAAVLLLSEDLDEIMALSDRIAVIYEGCIRGILPAVEATTEKLGLLMAGAC
jgi:simple sugar transport system ATP-binding protein